MKRQNSFGAVKSLIFAITIFAGITNISGSAPAKDIAGAKAVSRQTITVITANLTRQLRADLADNSVIVEIKDAERYQASAKGIEIKGSGICLIKADNNQLPIRFEAKINGQAQIVGSIKYDFVQFETSEFAPSTTEEILMKELMKKVSSDFKTDSVVISIDGFETSDTTDGKEFVGNGEIKIGEVEWKKIKFDVILASDNRASKVQYDVKK